MSIFDVQFSNKDQIIREQAERIKELEAEVEKAQKWQADEMEDNRLLREQLAALHQRIADAPVVALVVDDPHAVGWTKTRMLKPCVDGTKLISKEDLQK